MRITAHLRVLVILGVTNVLSIPLQASSFSNATQEGHSDGIMTTSLQQSSHLPNLVPSDVEVDRMGYTGSEINVRWLVRNFGAYAGASNNAIFLEGPGLDGPVRIGDYHPNGPLPPTWSTHKHGPPGLKLPSELTAGVYRLTIKVDPDNRVVESDEGDNDSTVILKVEN